MNDSGIISRMFVWLFGANWSTSLSGYVAVLAYAVHNQPEIIQWIPEPYRTFVWNISEWVFLGGMLTLAQQVKSRKVTGGTVQQTTSGAKADEISTSVVETHAAQQ